MIGEPSLTLSPRAQKQARRLAAIHDVPCEEFVDSILEIVLSLRPAVYAVSLAAHGLEQTKGDTEAYAFAQGELAGILHLISALYGDSIREHVMQLVRDKNCLAVPSELDLFLRQHKRINGAFPALEAVPAERF